MKDSSKMQRIYLKVDYKNGGQYTFKDVVGIAWTTNMLYVDYADGTRYTELKEKIAAFKVGEYYDESKDCS